MNSAITSKPKNSKKSYDDLSKALRHNLLRRKQQTRGRDTISDDTEEKSQMIDKPGSVKSNAF